MRFIYTFSLPMLAKPKKSAKKRLILIHYEKN